jgi:hypothetical protein
MTSVATMRDDDVIIEDVAAAAVLLDGDGDRAAKDNLVVDTMD